MDAYTISVLAFFGIIAILIYRDRKNVEWKYIVFMRRTKRGIEIIDKIAKYSLFWKIFGTFAVFAAFILMMNGMYVLVLYGNLLLSGEVKQPGLSFVFPSTTTEVIVGRGYIGIPFWFWITIIASVVFPHELSHGILSRVEKIRVKSMGLLLFAIFPGAFVEPDEKQLKKAGFWSKMRIFAVGSFSNFLVYLLVFYLASSVLWTYYIPGYIVLTNVTAGGPAQIAGLKPGMVITEVNKMKLTYDYSDYLGGYQILNKSLNGLKVGDEITLTANGTLYDVVLGKATNSTSPWLGIQYMPAVNGDPNFVFSILFELLKWMWILNYTIAIVNIFPIYPLDGGLMIEALAEKFSKRHSKKITLIITLITVFIFLINVLVPFLIL